MKRKALVTGGAGFIGSHLVRYLLAEGVEVTVVDDLSSGDRSAVGEGAEFVNGDVRDARILADAAVGCDWIFHLAAFVNLPDSFAQRELCMSINVDGTRSVLDAALKGRVKKVVFSSTSALYSDATSEPKREGEDLLADSPYAESKLIGEQLLAEYRHKGVDSVALRYFNVFGPGQPADSDYAAVIPLFIARALAGEKLLICGDGRQTRDFVYVEDVARANGQTARSAAGGVYNVGTGRAVEILQLAADICQLLDLSPDFVYSERRPGDALSSTACTRRAREVLGWSAQWDFKEGLRQTLAWWKSKNRELVNG